MAYLPSPFVLPKRSIDGKTLGPTLVGTTDSGTQRFIPTIYTVHASSATGVTVVGAFSIGTNSTSYNNVVPTTTMTGLTAVNAMTVGTVGSAAGSVASSTGIYINITLPFTASGAVTLDVVVEGYYM